MAPVVSTAWLAAAVARITGDPGSPGRHTKRYRISVTSSDGRPCGVSVQVGTHATEAKSAQLNQIADRWHIDRKDIMSILNDENWTPERLTAHLSKFTKADLMPPNYRR